MKIDGTVRILCIEDSEDDFLLFRTHLGRNRFFKFDATQQTRIKDALSYLEGHSFDVIFLDLHLPDASGCETLSMIFDKVSHTPIIVRTDSEDPTFTYDAIDRGAQDFILKSNEDSNQLARAIIIAMRRKQFEQKILLEKDTAERLNHFKSAFLANMSHEIRTPMNGVVGIASIMVVEDPEQKKHLDTIRKSADHLLSIVNNILDMSKIEAGMVELERTEIEIRPILDHVLDMFSEIADKKGIALFNKIDSKVPRAIESDSTYLRQICANLVNNALKFTASGEVTLSCTLEQRVGDQCTLRFEVRDTGVGISPDKLETIFRPFEQAEASTTRKFGGTGLGLAICQQLVGLMGGQLGVSSTEGFGATFWFHLPTREIKKDYVARPSLKNKSITLIGDNLKSLNYLSDILRARMGGRIETVLLGVGQATHPDIPSADVTLVDITNNDLLSKELIDDRAQGSICCFTGGRSNPSRFTGTQLAKPYKQSDIYRTLAMVLEGQMAAVPRGYDSQPKYKLSVLVAEDDPINQVVTRAILKKFGVTADIANNGAEALELARVRDYDLVLMDCHMPELDGYGAASAIRQLKDQNKANVPIIALTADALLGAEQCCVAAGMDSYLSKPVQSENLRKAIDQVLGRKGKRR